jgi:hypothetical protein
MQYSGGLSAKTRELIMFIKNIKREKNHDKTSIGNTWLARCISNRLHAPAVPGVLGVVKPTGSTRPHLNRGKSGGFCTGPEGCSSSMGAGSGFLEEMPQDLKFPVLYRKRINI